MIHRIEFYGSINEEKLKNCSYDLYPFKSKAPYIGFLSFDVNTSNASQWSGPCQMRLLIGNLDLTEYINWDLTVDNDKFLLCNGQLGLDVTINLSVSASKLDWNHTTLSIVSHPGQPDLEAQGAGMGLYLEP